jgi:TRAP-type uncharacterized transport system fused permease subunit
MTIGVAFERYFLRDLRIWENILLATTGVCIFIPNMVTRGFALAFLAVFLINHLMKEKKTRGKIMDHRGPEVPGGQDRGAGEIVQ